MTNLIAKFFSFLPAELVVFLVGATPFSELRGAIPLALGVYKLSPLSSFVWAVLGNITASVVVIWLLGPISGFLITRFNFADKFFAWLFARTRHKFSGNYETLGELALFIFVAIPLPMTGAWTGAVASFLFGIPKKRSLALISLGVTIAGLIVLLSSLGFFHFIL